MSKPAEAKTLRDLIDTTLVNGLDFKQVAEEAHDNSRAHGFHDIIQGRHQVALRLMLIISEVSEAFEEYRTCENPVSLSDAFVEELADVYIRLGDLVVFPEIGLLRFGAIVEAKLKKNRARPFRHGGKVL